MSRAVISCDRKRRSSTIEHDNFNIEDEEKYSEKTEKILKESALKKATKDPFFRSSKEFYMFGEHLKEADIDRVEITRESLSFECKKDAADRMERDKEREHRRGERKNGCAEPRADRDESAQGDERSLLNSRNLSLKI